LFFKSYIQRCWAIPKDVAKREFVQPRDPATLEMIKLALREFKREQDEKVALKRQRKKGKKVPGKNLSKNSQCDGNDEEEPGVSKRTQRSNSRIAAKKARQTIAQQTPLIDSQLPKGDKPFRPLEEPVENDYDDDDDEDDDYDDDDVGEESTDDEGNERAQNESMDDDFQSARSFQPRLEDLEAEIEHCWIESFDLELNSKRIDAFSIPSK
jgi:hypothetical protein